MSFNEEYVKKLLPQRPENSHKGIFGHVLNIAGSGRYTGAAYFSSLAPLRAGCGMATLASIETVLRSIAAISPDIILMSLEQTGDKTISPKSIKQLRNCFANYEVISVGCGLYINNDTIKFFKTLIKSLDKWQKPIVIDADGLNILSSLKIPYLPPKTILTPHPKELSRLLMVDVEEILLQPEFWIKKCCEKYNCTTILKTYKTIVMDNEGHSYINDTGNSALSHGGSGDVLCGMISGFLAQGLNCFDASCLAVYLHGVAAEIASRDLTEYSTLSSDLLDYIPKAIKSIL